MSTDDLEFLKDAFALIPPHVIEQVKRAIEAAREEGRQERLHMAGSIHVCELQAKEAYAQGVTDERERTTKIADNHNGCVDVKCLSESNCGATISNQIRAPEWDE